MQDENPHTKRPPRIVPFQDMKPFYFITFNTFGRHRILNTSAVHEAFISFCRTAHEQYGVAVGRYVIMPDHVHLFVVMPPDVSLPRWVATLKNFLGKRIEVCSGVPVERQAQHSSAATRAATQRPIWQRGFFDRLLRHGESYNQKWEYVRMNPVRATLCETPEQWEFQGEIMRIPFD